MYSAVGRWCRRRSKRLGQRHGDGGRTGQRPASGTTAGAISGNDALVAGAQEFVPGRVLVDGPGQVVLAQMDQERPVRSVGHSQLQLAARHVLHAFVRQGPEPVEVALLVSILYGY